MCDRDCDIEKMLREQESLLVSDYNAALDLAGFDSRDTILDIATGSGRMLQQLLLRGYSVISGDVDPKALERARERLGDLASKPTLVILDAHNLEFSDGSFRAVTFVNAIHEIDDPYSALDEITRVLSYDGKLLVVEFNAKGFELMKLHHQMQGKGEHRDGEMTTEDIDRYLHSSFERVKACELGLVHVWVASEKKRRK